MGTTSHRLVFGQSHIPGLDELDAEIAGLQEQYDNLTPDQLSGREFDLAVNQSPFLNAPIEVEGFKGPYYQYLAGRFVRYLAHQQHGSPHAGKGSAGARSGD